MSEENTMTAEELREGISQQLAAVKYQGKETHLALDHIMSLTEQHAQQVAGGEDYPRELLIDFMGKLTVDDHEGTIQDTVNRYLKLINHGR